MDRDTRVGCYAWVEREISAGESAHTEVLLVRWPDTPAADGRVILEKWSLPGGGMELGETPEQTATREVTEETGYEIGLTGLLTTAASTVLAEDRIDGADRPVMLVQIVFTGSISGGALTNEVDGTTDQARWVRLDALDSISCSNLVDRAWRATGGAGLARPPVADLPSDTSAIRQIRAAALQRGPRSGSVTVIAVDGPSGAGKTHLATALARELNCPLVQMDDLYAGWDGLADAPRLLAEQVLAPLAAGGSAEYRRWDWHADGWGESVTAPPTDVLVVEGCGASVGPAAPYAAVAVWLEAEPSTRMRRGLARDGETFRPHWNRWAAQEEALFSADATRDRADLIISTEP